MTKYSVPSFGGHIDFSDDVTIYPVLVMARTGYIVYFPLSIRKQYCPRNAKEVLFALKDTIAATIKPFFQRREISNKKVQKVQMKRFKWRVYQSKIAEREVCLAARWSRLTCFLKVERRRPAGSTQL